MKTFHHFLAVLLAVLLCLSLTACGDSSDDVTGDDWRASGVVAAEGTITHEGEGSVKVLVTVGPESAAFYRDEPEQELFDSVSFPVTVEDVDDDRAGFDISFDDITGDGESDVVVTFQHADMSTTQMVWFWDADEHYVFEPDYSYLHENGVQTDLTDTPYFSDNGLQINAAVNTGTYLLENGVACYSGLGDGYERNDCYWEVVKHSDQSHDGIREIQFDAICYIPESSIPYFTEQYITNTDSELYDYYTGMWFTAATAYGNSQRGDNYYVHTVNYNGNEYLIEFAYSTDWQYNVSDWAMVLTKSYMVYLPDDYDGLVFAATPQLDNYKDCARRMQLDSIAPETSIMDTDLVDPYNTLFFSICY